MGQGTEGMVQVTYQCGTGVQYGGSTGGVVQGYTGRGVVMVEGALCQVVWVLK